MSTSETLDNIRSRILSQFSFLFLTTWEEQRWEAELSSLALEIERGLVVWSVTQGAQPPLGQDGQQACDPRAFVDQIAAYPPDHIFLVKDFHPYLNDPHVIRKLRDLVTSLPEQNKTLLFMGPDCEIPIDLQKEAIKLELPLPGLAELAGELKSVLKEQQADNGRKLEMSAEEEEKLLKAVLGLTAREARKAIGRGLLGRDKVDDEVYALLVAEKKHMVQGSDMLEFQELDEGVKDVGGLDGLKDWIARRGEAFSSRAQEQGIPAPKGVLLLGVQGCGKSLTSRAIARLLSFPLVRLDISSLLSSDRGSSEKNMRDVLKLMETIAPAVLWLDEIEKGFAGSVGEGGADPTMVRIMGRFLTWMQENPAPVFVVATANSVTGLPPEMLRRGRFDELFFVDLPNYHERIDIFNIHLGKRGWKPEKYDVEALAERTEGFSGAEIEQVVVSAMVETFSRGGILSDVELERARDETVPLSVTMEEKIFELREWARSRCRQATPDSRVLQMLEAEQREKGQTGEFSYDEDEAESDEDEEWIQLAEHGQLSAAITEFVRNRETTTFPELHRAFEEYIETEGEQGLALRSDPNVVLWVGMSAELAGALAKLIAAKKLYLHQGEVEQYADDRNGMKLPMLKELPDNRVTRPAWLPTYLSDMPAEGGSGRFSRVARMKLSK